MYHEIFNVRMYHAVFHKLMSFLLPLFSAGLVLQPSSTSSSPSSSSSSTTATTTCGSFVSNHDGAVYATSAAHGKFKVETTSCPEGDRPPSPFPSPQQHNRQLLELEINGTKHIFVQRDDAMEVFAYSGQECQRQQRLSVNGTPQACVYDRQIPELVCVVYNHSHSQVQVFVVIAKFSGTWTANPEPFWASPCYNFQLTKPYMFEKSGNTHLIFGAGDILVHTAFHRTDNIDPPTGVGLVRGLYVLNNEELLLDFGSSVYTYSLSSAKFALYFRSPLDGLVITDFAVNSNGTSGTIFNSTAIQVTFSASRCAFMQVPKNTQVKHVEFFNETLFLVLVDFDNHSVLYKIGVETIGELPLETAESCKNISFEAVSAPLLNHSDTNCSHCRGFTVNDPLLMVDNCGRAVDVYVFGREYAVQYVGTVDGVTTCELEPFGSPVDPNQCLQALVSDGDNTTLDGNDSHSDNATHPPDVPSPPPPPPPHITHATLWHPTVIIGAFAALVSLLLCIVIVFIVICVLRHWRLYRKGQLAWIGSGGDGGSRLQLARNLWMNCKMRKLFKNQRFCYRMEMGTEDC